MWSWLKRVLQGGASGLCIPADPQKQPHTLSPSTASLHAEPVTAATACSQPQHSSCPSQAVDDAPCSNSSQGSPAPRKQPLQELQGVAAASDQRERDTTPPLQLLSSYYPQGRYIVSDGKPVGIANTVSKYKENQPLVAHLTPFEERVAKKLNEEQRVAAAMAAASAASASASASANAHTPLESTSCGNGRSADIKQKLFWSAGEAAGGVARGPRM